MENNNINNIERYVRGEMDTKEAESFEAQIAGNTELQEQVAWHQDLSTVLQRKKVVADVFAELKTEDFFSKEEVKQNKSTTQKEAKVVRMKASNMRKVFSLAASFLVLVVAGSLFFSNSNYSNSVLSNMQLESLKMMEDRGSLKSEEVIANPFAEGLEHIENQEYEKAISFFQAIDASTNRYEAAQLYLAYAQRTNGNEQTALDLAEQLSEQAEESVAYRAEWLALQILLQQDQVDNAFRVRLNAFTQKSGVFKDEARVLQQKLNGFWRRLVF